MNFEKVALQLPRFGSPPIPSVKSPVLHVPPASVLDAAVTHVARDAPSPNGSPRGGSGGGIKCIPCGKEFASAATYNNHCASAKHLKTVASRGATPTSSPVRGKASPKRPAASPTSLKGDADTLSAAARDQWERGRPQYYMTALRAASAFALHNELRQCVSELGQLLTRVTRILSQVDRQHATAESSSTGSSSSSSDRGEIPFERIHHECCVMLSRALRLSQPKLALDALLLAVERHHMGRMEQEQIAQNQWDAAGIISSGSEWWRRRREEGDGAHVTQAVLWETATLCGWLVGHTGRGRAMTGLDGVAVVAVVGGCVAMEEGAWERQRLLVDVLFALGSVSCACELALGWMGGREKSEEGERVMEETLARMVETGSVGAHVVEEAVRVVRRCVCSGGACAVYVDALLTILMNGGGVVGAQVEWEALRCDGCVHKTTLLLLCAALVAEFTGNMRWFDEHSPPPARLQSAFMRAQSRLLAGN